MIIKHREIKLESVIQCILEKTKHSVTIKNSSMSSDLYYNYNPLHRNYTTITTLEPIILKVSPKYEGIVVKYYINNIRFNLKQNYILLKDCWLSEIYYEQPEYMEIKIEITNYEFINP